MGTFFFLYSCTAIVLMATACSTSIVLWVINRARSHVYAAALFAAYATELVLLLLEEYSRSKARAGDMFEAELSNPLASVAISAVFVISCWLWMLSRTYCERDRGSIYLVPAGWLVVCLTLGLVDLPLDGLQPILSELFPDMSVGAFQQYLYWIWRDLGLVGCLAMCTHRIRRDVSEVQRRGLDRVELWARVMLLLCIVLIAEDTYVVLFFRPASPTGIEADLFWYLSGRNITENLLMAVNAALLIRCNYQGFLLYFRHAPKVSEEGAAADLDVERRISLYCDAHALSEREREVLALMVAGHDAQNIASKLFISASTVRVHQHRIYGKTGTATREELIDAFWKG